MSEQLVTLVNPNLVHPPVAPYALDILTTALEREGFDVEVVDLTFRRDDWRTVLGDYFAQREPLLVGVTIRNIDTINAQKQRSLVAEHREIVQEIRANTDAPVIAGGVGFSAMPFALVDYFDIPFGVKGPGERVVCGLARALRKGLSPHTVPGLLVNEGGGGIVSTLPEAGAGFVDQVDREGSYRRHSRTPWRVDNLTYYERGGLGNILTKNGCPFACAHCVEPDAKGNRFARRTISAVVDEMEVLIGQGIRDLHTADSEFNLSIRNSKEILREIIRRKNSDAGSLLHQLRLWIYIQPAPFDEEFAELLAAAGCQGMNIAPDHVRDEMLDGWKVTAKGTRYYTFDDVAEVCRLASRYGMLTLVEALFGMPGETWETVRDGLEQTLALDATVVGFGLGIRIFPYSPLGLRLARECGGERTVRGLQSNVATEPIVLTPPEDCVSKAAYERQFMVDADGTQRPVFYFSPDLPEDPRTVASPNGRWTRTLELMREHIPDSELHRVMVPTVSGSSQQDANYADNPFLACLLELGYRGAYWSYWPRRDEIIQEARDRGLASAGRADGISSISR